MATETTPKPHTLTRAEHHAALTRRGLVPDPKTGRWGHPKLAKAPVVRKLPTVSTLPELAAPVNPAATVTIAWGNRTVTILMPTNDRRDSAASAIEALLHIIATQRSQEQVGMLADYTGMLDGDVAAVLAILDELKLIETK